MARLETAADGHAVRIIHVYAGAERPRIDADVDAAVRAATGHMEILGPGELVCESDSWRMEIPARWLVAHEPGTPAAPVVTITEEPAEAPHVEVAPAPAQ